MVEGAGTTGSVFKDVDGGWIASIRGVANLFGSSRNCGKVVIDVWISRSGTYGSGDALRAA